MLIATMITAITSVLFFFVANRIHYSYNKDLRTMSNTLFDIGGIILGIAFIALMFYNGVTFYTIPNILLFISVCTYIRYKKRKKFCTPAWKCMHITALSYSTLGVFGMAINIIEIDKSAFKVDDILRVIIIGIILVFILTPLTHTFFSVYPGRYKKAKYYY